MVLAAFMSVNGRQDGRRQFQVEPHKYETRKEKVCNEITQFNQIQCNSCNNHKKKRRGCCPSKWDRRTKVFSSMGTRKKRRRSLILRMLRALLLNWQPVSQIADNIVYTRVEQHYVPWYDSHLKENAVMDLWHLKGRKININISTLDDNS